MVGKISVVYIDIGLWWQALKQNSNGTEFDSSRPRSCCGKYMVKTSIWDLLSVIKGGNHLNVICDKSCILFSVNAC